MRYDSVVMDAAAKLLRVVPEVRNSVINQIII